MAVLDEEKQSSDSIGDEHMRQITGISKKEEADIDRQAQTSSDSANGFVSPEALGNAEASGDATQSDEDSSESTETEALTQHENQIGEGYKKDKDSGIAKIAGRFAGLSGGKKALLGGGLFGSLIIIVFMVFLSLLPLKINHIVENLTSHFFASSESAVGTRTEILFSNYLKKYVMPGMTIDGPCSKTKTISKSCVATVQGETPAARLYNGWRDARLENTLSSKYGIEIQRVPGSNSDGNYKLLVDGTNTSIDITGFRSDPTKNNIFAALGGRNDVRQQFRDAFAQETLWKRVMYRFKVGRLLERKYGIERCLFICKTKDSFADWKDAKTGQIKQKIATSLLSVRVLDVRAQAGTLILSCMLTSTCDKFSTSGTDFERQDGFEKDMAKALEDLDTKLAKYTASDILKEAQKYQDSGGFTKYLIDKVINHFVNNESQAETLSNIFPVLGQINNIAGWITKIKSGVGHLKRWIYVANATAMVSVFVMYRSQADELKDGQVDSALLGEMVKSLGENAGDGNHQGQPAESTPLYSELMGGTPATTASIFNIFTPSAYAQSTTPAASKYTCADNKPIPTGKLVCSEESLQTSGPIASLTDLINGPVFKPLTDLANLWNGTAGQVFNWISKLGSSASSAILQFTGAQSIIDAAEGVVAPYISQFLQDIAGQLFPSPISDNPSGGSTFDNIAGGADVSGNDYAQYGTGAARISDATAATIRSQQENDARTQFASQPFFARMFDKDSPYSFISKVAMTLPMNASNFTQNSFASLISEPFTKLAQAFSSLFTTHWLYAATASPDPFSIPQMGYNPNDPNLNINPDILTDSYCANLNKIWADNDVVLNPTTGDIISRNPLPEDGDPNTGTDVHTTTNPCLLESAATGSAGAMFTDSVLTKEDMTDPGGGSSSSGSTTALNANAYILGDSLTAGMATAGLGTALQQLGWNPTIEGECGRHLVTDGSSCAPPPVLGGLNQVDQLADQAAIKSAGVVVIGLGTNDAGSPTYSGDVTTMINKIKALNPSAKIYWTNLFSTDGNAATYGAMDATLAGLAGTDGFTIIDWASQAAKVGAYTPGTYHPSDYQPMVDFVSGQLGKAP